MKVVSDTFLTKLKWAMPWLTRYPLWRGGELARRLSNKGGKQHLIFTIADHFEPAWMEGGLYNLDTQRRRLDDYYQKARQTGEAVRDVDGTKFRHTNFYPAEQYHRPILETAAAMQAEGLGEVEVHLHHGVEQPDTAANTRRQLIEFRDLLAEEHRCLSRWDGEGMPQYAFVHGNWALANSAGGRCCGVDNEMEILAETGCYVDMSLPSPGQTQVPMLNAIYECGLPFDQAVPHRAGTPVKVGQKAEKLPLIFTGPLIFNWSRRIKGLPVPRIDDGELAANQPMDLARLARWQKANISVLGRPEWVFIKLYCHGFFDYDQEACIGESARRFFSEIIENGVKTNSYDVYFASAREAFNMVLAAMDGNSGSPGQYRDYRLQAIMSEKTSDIATGVEQAVVTP